MKILTIITLLSMTSHVLACRYYVNEKANKETMRAVLLASIEGGSDEIKAEASLTTYTWFESISTPMCPEELTHKASFDVVKKIMTPGAYMQSCVGKVKVTKIDDWKTRKVSFIIEGENQLRCTR
jgi:hypothetical protein